jgi:hypothetical protein
MSSTASRRVTLLPALASLALAACQDATAPTTPAVAPVAAIPTNSTTSSSTTPPDTSLAAVAPRLLPAPPPPTDAPVLADAAPTAANANGLTPDTKPSRLVVSYASGYVGSTSVGRASCVSADGALAIYGRTVLVPDVQTSISPSMAIWTVLQAQVFLYQYVNNAWTTRPVAERLLRAAGTSNLGLVNLGPAAFYGLPAGVYHVKVLYSWWTFYSTLYAQKMLSFNASTDYLAPPTRSQARVRPGRAGASSGERESVDAPSRRPSVSLPATGRRTREPRVRRSAAAVIAPQSFCSGRLASQPSAARPLMAQWGRGDGRD